MQKQDEELAPDPKRRAAYYATRERHERYMLDLWAYGAAAGHETQPTVAGAQCFRCSLPVPPVYEWSVGTGFCLCCACVSRFDADIRLRAKINEHSPQVTPEAGFAQLLAMNGRKA